MKHVVVYHENEIVRTTSIRDGELKIGQRIRTLEEGRGLEALSGCAERGVQFVLLGIPESIGPQANFGRSGAEKGWEAFLEFFLNVQSNRFLTGNEVLCLGHIDTAPLQREASRLDPSGPERVRELRLLCGRLDEMVAPVVEAVVHSGLKPVIIGGGHNNACPIIKGVSRGLKATGGIQCVNCDPHGDFRPLEGRHSGNGFSYAYSEGYLERYFVFGLHESYNSEWVMEQIEANADIGYSPFDDLKDVPSHLEMAHRFLNQSILPVGVEVDMDSISDMPSSAMSPSGFRLEEVRRFVQTMAFRLDTAYLHLSEGAPAGESHSRTRVGKSLAYLAIDYIKMSLCRLGQGGTGQR